MSAESKHCEVSTGDHHIESSLLRRRQTKPFRLLLLAFQKAYIAEIEWVIVRFIRVFSEDRACLRVIQPLCIILWFCGSNCLRSGSGIAGPPVALLSPKPIAADANIVTIAAVNRAA